MTSETKERIKQTLLFKISKATQEKPLLSHRFPFLMTFFRFAAVPLVLVLMLTATTYASATALPGEWLYSVKRAIEKSRIALSMSEKSKIELEVKFAEERVNELNRIKSLTPRVNLNTNVPDTAKVDRTPTKLEVQANQDVSISIDSLEQKKTKLREKGHTEAAIDLDKKITDLKNRSASTIQVTPKEPIRQQNNRILK